MGNKTFKSLYISNITNPYFLITEIDFSQNINEYWFTLFSCYIIVIKFKLFILSYLVLFTRNFLSFQLKQLSQPSTPKEKVGELLFTGCLTEKQWFQLDDLYREMYQEYKTRRNLLLTRLDVTIKSFLWADRLKVCNLLYF